MTAAERFVALLAAIIATGGGLGAGMVFLLKGLWQIRGAWDRTNNELHVLVERVAVMAGRDDRMESRMERHEQWHADRPGRGR